MVVGAQDITTETFPGGKVTVDATELNQVLRDLDRAVAEPPEDLLELIGQDLIEGVENEFETAGRGRWAPHAPSTVARRGADAQILVDTDRMRGGVHAEPAEGSWVEISTDAEYAVYHTSEEPRTKIPLRDFFDIDEKYYERAAETLLDGIIAEAGFR